MPVRAEDAAIVPVTMRVTLPPGDARYLKALTLVIDDNPAPVAATFTIGHDAGISTISTRVRVNAYTNVHAVAELSDDKLYVVKTYVKASGGCSAPAAKNADEATANFGQMKFREFAKPPKRRRKRAARSPGHGRHPNNSGLQRDQVTLLYIPPHFVDELSVWQGDALLFSMVAGISISEDPNFRFTFIPNGAARSASKPRTPTGKVPAGMAGGRNVSAEAVDGERARLVGQDAPAGHWPSRHHGLREGFDKPTAGKRRDGCKSLPCLGVGLRIPSRLKRAYRRSERC